MNADLARSSDGAPSRRSLVFNGIDDDGGVRQQERDSLRDNAGPRDKFALRQQRGGEFSERSSETWALGRHGLRPHGASGAIARAAGNYRQLITIQRAKMRGDD